MTRSAFASALAAALAAALASVLAAGCAPARPAAPEAPRSVTTAHAARRTIEISVGYAARIRAREEILVSSKVSGRVAAVNAEVGQQVRRGQLLFSLEPGDYDAQVRQARAAVDSARANLTRTSDSSLSSQVIQAQAAVKQAQVQYDDAKDLFERTQKLYNDGTVTRQQLDSAEARMKSADISLGAARDSLALIQEKGGPQSTGLASTQVDQAQAALDLAESQLSNTRIISPITGVVASRNVDRGELVSSSVPAFVVIDVSTVTAEASVSESIVEKIHRGEKVSLAVDAVPGAGKIEGTVDTISPAADARGYTVKVAVGNPGNALRPGMFARVSFPVDTRKNALVVPNGAVVTEMGVEYVFAVAGGAVKKTAVETGISDEEVTEITQGLHDGAMVVTEGQSFLTDGQKVRPVE